MDNQKSRKLGMGICIAVMIFGIAALIIYLILGDDINKEPVQEELTQQVEQQPVFVNGPDDGISAVWLESGTDINNTQDIVPALGKISHWGFKSVIFSGIDSSSLTYAVNAAESLGLYSIVKVNADSVLNGGVADETAINEIIASGVDSVMIGFSPEFSSREVEVAAKAVRRTSDKVYLGIYATATAEYTPVCSAGLFDYKYVDLCLSTSDIKGDFINYLNSYIDGTTAYNVFGMHAELVGNAKGFEKPEEIIIQLKSVSQVASDGFGFYRYGVLDKNEDGITDAITEYMTTGIMKDFFKKLNFSKPEKKKFETSESMVPFVGTADIKHPLLFNGEKVEMIEDGYFAFDAGLLPGKNTFVFEHKGEKVTYEVTYKPVLIKKVEPSGKMNAPGGASLDISALALKSASVTAVINGNSITLTRSDTYGDEEVADTGSDYSYFVGSYILPESKTTAQNLGKIQVVASYSGQTQTVGGATVIVNAEEIEQPTVPETTVEETTPAVTEAPTDSVTSEEDVGVTSTDSSEQDSSQSETQTTTQTTTPTTTAKPSDTQIFEQLSPEKYNGVSGKSKMVVVTRGYAETLPASTTSDISYPYYTPLPKGTVDYVKSTVSYDGMNYYVLRSGRRVYQNDVKYLSSGYNMPSNEIRTVGVNKTTTATEITLTLKWRVPFNVRENPQDYYLQSPDRPYSVNSFTAEYIDIVFYYTSSVDEAPQFSSNVISRAAWLDNKDEGAKILRLYLKNKGCFYGIKYYYNSDGTLTFSVKERNSSAISGKVVMLDAGHGGNDPGAIGAVIVGSTNVHEATINLSIANKMKAKLEALGAKVVMTRTSAGQTVSLDQRHTACRNTNPDIFVAVHCDSSTSSSPSGTTAYYYKSYSYPLAKCMSEGIVAAYKNTVYASNSAMASKVNKGTNVMAFRVTRVEECPSVLIEFGYVSNVVECKALISDSNQDALAQGAVNGIVNYFKNS